MFERHEERIRELIKKTHAPVLGLLGGLIPSEARVAIKEDVRQSPGALPFAHRLEQYPALYGVWLAEHVMAGLGATGHFDVYPHVSKAIGGSTGIDVSDKALLWRSFRRAILRLGIQPLSRTSGPHYMADEYVRQAGVPLAFADDLALKMLVHAKALGVPDEDDQEGLLMWQLALLNRLVPPFSITARKAIERDFLAFYTRTFLRVYANHGQASAGDALEAAFATAFVNEGGTTNIKRAAIPQLLYRDGVLGVLFPPTAGPARYELRSGGPAITVRTEEEGGFRQLPGELPNEVQVFTADGERVLNVKLWQDRASNRLLVFNEAGRLRASAQLGQTDTIELLPGNYVALCRFTPTNTHEWTEISDEPQLVEVPLQIRPGAELELFNGPARVDITGQNLPSFRLDGKLKAGLERVEFYYGHLNGKIEIPPDWRQAGQQAFEVRVSSGGAIQRLPLALSEDGTCEVELQSALPQLDVKPGMRRLVIELGRIGEARSLQRQSILYWVGLSSISYGLRFSYSQRPQNLALTACSGLKFNDTLAEPGNEVHRVLHIGFDVGGGRLIHLSWNRPGLFVEVEVPSRDGTMSRVSRPLGSTETVSLTHQKNIIVSASEPGFISLGEWRQFVDFERRPSKAFSASFLASRLEPSARTLKYETHGGGAEMSLLVLSQPHLATALATSRMANTLEICVTLQGEPAALAITGKELATGRELRVEQEVIAGEWRSHELARMQMYSVQTGVVYLAHIHIDMQTLPQGVWTLVFGARIGGVWGRLEDAQEGRITVPVAVDALGHELSASAIVADVPALELHDAIARLGRVNEHFQQLWSPTCWEQQAWLSSYWTALVQRVRGQEQAWLMPLADMAMVRAADDTRQGYMPKQSIGAMLPALFSMQRAEYRRINVKAHPLAVAFRAMPELRGSIVPAFESTLHQVAAFAFKNVGEVARGMRPKGFMLDKYVQTLRQTPLVEPHRCDDESFLPGNGELLGPIHLAQAWRDFERGYATSLLMQSARKALALSLSRALHQKSSKFDAAAPIGLRGHPIVFQLQPMALDGVDETEQQRQENLIQLANACAWFAWYCRLEVRQPGAFASFHERLVSIRRTIEMAGNGVDDCLAYYLQVAPAMFSYYLLLWELVLTVELDPVVQNG